MAKYVYGIVDPSTKAPSEEGIAGGRLDVIAGDGTAALVSDVAQEELAFGREAVLTHARVLEAALTQGPVLPMRFGTILDGADEVRRQLLDDHAAELRAQLHDFKGKVELRVRATYNEEALLREVVREDHDVARLRESLRGAPDDATYYGRIRLGELVSAAVQRKREHDARQLLDALSPFAVAVEAAEPAHERVALNASFLLERQRVADFEDVLEGLAQAQAQRMVIKLTGPLPPHSFVELAGRQ